MILLENVLYLVGGDSVHGIYSQLVQQAAALGYVLVQQLKVEDSTVGGSTQRARVFLIWEKKSLNSKLPAWEATVKPLLGLDQRSLSASLLPVQSLPDSVWITGATEVFNPDVPIKLHTATKVGHLTRKGDLDNLKVGDLVGVHANHDGM